MNPLSLENKPLILILGATGTGKTRIAKEISQIINGSIINCDASQIYQELNIGTNKTNFSHFSQPSYLFDIKKPDEEYSIQIFQSDARKAINDSWKKGLIPILTGGSILYALSCICDFKYSKKRLDVTEENQFTTMDNMTLHNLLKNIDPLEAEKTHFNNRSRVIRALEIFKNEGLSKTDYNNKQNKEYIYKNIFIFGLNIGKDELNTALKLRIEKQFADGLLEEVSQLSKKYSSELLSMQAIGYKEIIHGKENNIPIESIKEIITKNTLKYAKHQNTFLKKIKNLEYIDVNLNDLSLSVQAILKILKK